MYRNFFPGLLVVASCVSPFQDSPKTQVHPVSQSSVSKKSEPVVWETETKEAAQPSKPSADPIISWVYDRMISWSPPGRSFIREAQETPEEGRARYRKIAEDLLRVTYDPSEKPAFGDSIGRARTTAMMLSISWFESGFRKDVDLGSGSQARGDSGRSWCLIQAQLGSPNFEGKTGLKLVLSSDEVFFKDSSDVAKNPPGPEFLVFGGEDLVRSHDSCFRAGLRMARKSLSLCSRLPVMERLAGLSGSCDRGQRASRARMSRAVSMITDNPPPMTDSEVISALF